MYGKQDWLITKMEEHRMIRVEYGTENDFRYRMLTDDEVVKAFIKEFSSEDKKAEEIVLDIFKGIDIAVTDVELEVVEQAVKALVKKGNNNITEIVQKVLAPANKLAHYGREVLKKYCRGLDLEVKK